MLCAVGDVRLSCIHLAGELWDRAQASAGNTDLADISIHVVIELGSGGNNLGQDLQSERGRQGQNP